MESITINMHPIPGKDAQWLALCKHCDDTELFASRGGFKTGGIEHCYGCGNEKTTTGIKETDIERIKRSCRFHWEKFPIFPYNWHTLTEEEKWKILGTKK